MERTFSPMIRQYSAIDGLQQAYTLVYAAVSEQFDTSVAAVESGIRRMVDQLEEKPPLAWLAFKADTRLGSGKPTTGKLIYAVRDVVLRQKVPSTRL